MRMALQRRLSQGTQALPVHVPLQSAQLPQQHAKSMSPSLVHALSMINLLQRSGVAHGSQVIQNRAHLKGYANLRRCEPDSWSLSHDVNHVRHNLNQLPAAQHIFRNRLRHLVVSEAWHE